MSLRSQISETRALFHPREDPGTRKDKEVCSRRETYFVELPAFSKIQESLHIYFENVGRQYPAIRPEKTRSRIHDILEDLGYPSAGRAIYVHYVAAPTVALLCIIVAIAEIIENDTSPTDTGATDFANHARGLLSTFENLPPSLEALRCHTLITIYLLYMDSLDLALQSIAVTVRIAIALRLHQRSPSPREGSDSYDQNLWWTIYALDRNLAWLGGIPCLIRDEEIDAPRPTQNGQFQRFSAVTYTNCPDELVEQIGPIERSLHEEAKYLEALAYLGRIWACIWNELVTDRSEPDCRWQATEVLDAQLRILQKQLPAGLIWRSPSSLGKDEERMLETAMQRQLIVLMRINTLRLFIRGNPASNCTCLDRKSPHDNGVAISAETIGAIMDFSSHHGGLLPIGHSISTTLVQCILYLINIIGEPTNANGTESASSSVVSAYQVLVDLSDHCVSARNAVETLDEAILRYGDGPARPNTEPIPQPQPQCAGISRSEDLKGTHAQGTRQTRRRSGTSTASKEIPRGNDLFDCLQKSYESLDSLLPNSVHSS
ncbi:hypothetical protein N7491_010464 [Penicillium cf. griseofulvum]|nr:hypothetical protein N7491_010464 [Penicillium cf. griseofulvum]